MGTKSKVLRLAYEGKRASQIARKVGLTKKGVIKIVGEGGIGFKVENMDFERA